MSSEILKDRSTYRRSGKVKWARLVLLAPVPVVAGLLAAVGTCFLFYKGYYYGFILPVLVSLPVAGVCYLTTRWSHCRNRAVAAGIGLLGGLALYPGHYHVDFVYHAGPAALVRLDALPHYIVFRMNTDVEVEAGGEANEPDVVGNWFHFVIEQIVVLAIVIGISIQASRRAYCESCLRWMRTAMSVGPPGEGSRIAWHLAEGTLANLPEYPNVQGKVGQPSTTATVQCCRIGEEQAGCKVYLTLQETAGSGKAVKATSYLKDGEISVDELRFLAARLPGLAPVAPLGQVGDVVVARLAESAEDDDLAAGEPWVPDALAVIESLPPESGERVFNKKNTTVAVMLSLMPIGVLLLGIGLLVLAWWFRPWNAPDDSERLLLSIVSVTAGAAAVAFGLAVCRTNVDMFNFFYGRRITRNEIAMRPDAIVNPDDPEAVYVDVVPRERWTTLTADHPSDGGFLLVDRRNRRVLFEGAKQRYRIPAEAIVDCESVVTQPQAGSLAFYATVIKAYAADDSAKAEGGTASKIWEAPFMVRPTTFVRYNEAYRRISAEELRDSIREVMVT